MSPADQQVPILPSRRKRIPFVAGLGVGLLLIPAVVWASHQYSDVPTGHTFHDAITALTDTGIAAGTGGGLFKPQDPVTRGQMAAFIHRSAGRASVDTTLGGMPLGADTLLGSAALQLIGPTGGAQGVVVSVAMQLDHDTALTVACTPSLRLRLAGSPAIVDSWFIEFYADGAGHEESVAATFYTTQGSGTTVTYEIYGNNTCNQDLFTDEDILVVQNIPFDGAGTSPASLAGVTVTDEPDREE